MISTKQQERDALKKIRTIVENLGADSYIGKAFEGCFEIAESNIENDFFNSTKEREQLSENALAKANEQIIALKKENEWLKNHALSDEDANTLVAIVSERIAEYKKALTETSRRIVELAETPECDMFKQMVSENRTASRVIEKYAALIDRI